MDQNDCTKLSKKSSHYLLQFKVFDEAVRSVLYPKPVKSKKTCNIM